MAQINQMNDYILCHRAHAYMNLSSKCTKNCPGPRMSPVIICYHLCLINHCDIIFLITVKHLHCRCCNSAVSYLKTLLACKHGAWYACIIHLLIYLKCQKSKRSQINSVLRQLKPLKRLICLTAVSRAYMKYKAPFHALCFWKLKLRPCRNQRDNLSSKLLAAVLIVKRLHAPCTYRTYILLAQKL